MAALGAALVAWFRDVVTRVETIAHLPRGSLRLADGAWSGECTVPDDLYPFDDEATRRADAMLRNELGAEYDALQRRGYVDVESTMFRHTHYRLRMRRPIEVFKNGRRQPWRLCIVSGERVPPADELLMKLLWLRGNEEYVLTTANRVR